MIKNVISVLWTEIKFVLLKIMHFKRFTYKGIQRFSPRTVVCIDNRGSLSLGAKVRAHTGTRISVRAGASVQIGNDVAFSYNCLITAHEKVIIGNGCEIGPGVMMFDHDHNVNGHSIKEKKYKSSPIIIGNNVWIGANVIILRGAHIGDDCVVAAGTIVRSGNYGTNTILHSNSKTVESEKNMG